MMSPGKPARPDRPDEQIARRGGARRYPAFARSVTRFAPLLVLIALLAGASAVQPSLLSLYSLGVLADESSVILLMATAQTILILLGGIDLSMAALAALASVLTALTLPSMGVVGVLAALASTTLIGAFHGLIHTRAQIPSLIVTLAGLGLWSGTALMIAHTTIPVDAGDSVIGWLQSSSFGVPHTFGLALAAFFALSTALRWLPFGRYVRAIGMDERAALLSGIQVGRIKILVLALSGLFSGLAGLAMMARTSSGSPTIADNLLVPSIAAVLIGGTAITGGVGGLARTFAGVLTMTVLRVGIAVVGLDPAYEPILYGVLVIGAAALTIDRSKMRIVK